MKKWLFNPFIYVAGGKALIIGLVVMAATAIFGYFSNTHFDGVLDAHTGAITPIGYYFAEQLINWLCMVLVIFAAGRIFSRSAIRLIDVAGTLALARWPAYVVALAGFGIQLPETRIPEKLLESLTAPMILCMMVSMVFMIWMVALYYNAYRTSCNMKDGKSVGIFIATLLIAEILSKIIYSLFLYQ